jgi:hypothetical protein
MSKQQAEEAASGEALQNVTDTLLTDFLTQKKAAAELKICERTLDRWRRLGEGPPITKLGRRVLYRRSSLQAWLRTREDRGNEA